VRADHRFGIAEGFATVEAAQRFIAECEEDVRPSATKYSRPRGPLSSKTWQSVSDFAFGG
jgi:hypothetical protein